LEKRQAYRTEAASSAPADLAIRTRLQWSKKVRDLALFNVAIDSKLRGCDVVRLRIEDLDVSAD
jgi:hypothetical protein